jgi:hypothetical protein
MPSWGDRFKHHDRGLDTELSAGRVNHWELERVLAHHRDPSLPTEFD